MKPRVLMVATSLQAPGGVAAVLETWRVSGVFERCGVRIVATNGPGGAVAKGLAALRAWLQALWWIAVRRVPLVHVHTSSFASWWRKTPVLAAALLFRRPLIVSLHGGAFREFYQARGRLGRAWIRCVMRGAARFVVLTSEWRRWVESVEPRAQVCVLPNTVADPLASGHAAATRDAGHLLFLGRIEQAKGVYVLIEALARARAAGAGWRLTCAGSGEIERARAAAAALGLSERELAFVGWVAGDAKDELLAACDGVVLPSFIENMPVSLLEAYARGKPVIATRVGGVPDMVADGCEGFTVAPGDAAALADALIRAWHDRDGWSRMGRAARERFVRDYSCPVVIARLEGVYAQVLGEAIGERSVA